jgi:3-oxoadipate enol-lactonase
MAELKLDRVTLHYELDDFTDPWSKPETVLLHHGCGKHGRYWYRWVPILARKYKVITIDARGFGQSSDPGPDYKWSIEGFAKDVIALLDHLKIPQIYFVGEHMGAWAGIQLALDYPQRIKKLVFSGMPFFWTAATNMTGPIDKVGVVEWQLADEPYRFGGDEIYGRWFAEEMARSRTKVVKSVIQAASAVDYRNRLSDIKCPVLVLLGELYVKKNNGNSVALMREKLPKSSEVLVIDKGPMFVIYTMAELCAEKSMNFFARK